MKKQTFFLSILCLFFVCASCFCQTDLHSQHNLNVGFFGSNFGNDAKRFLILAPSYEFRTKVLNNKLGFGIIGTIVQDQNKKNNELGVGLRINYHFTNSGRLDPYFGIGLSYSEKKMEDILLKKGVELKYQLGCKYQLVKHLDVFGELSNYRFRTENLGVFPVFGISLKF
jgi:hypothetical protein